MCDVSYDVMDQPNSTYYMHTNKNTVLANHVIGMTRRHIRMKRVFMVHDITMTVQCQHTFVIRGMFELC